MSEDVVKPKRKSKEQPKQPTVQEIAMDKAILGLENGITGLMSSVINLQTASPSYVPTCNALKETIGDLLITQRLLQARKQKANG